MTSQEAIHLLVIDHAVEYGEAISTDLRNHGHPVRYRRVADLETLTQALADEAVDIVIAHHPLSGCSLHDVAHATHLHNADVPVIAICRSLAEIDWSDLQREDIHDAVEVQQQEHLRWVILREIRHSETSRQLQRYQRRYHESERRCRSLLASSRDAIAYIHDGMHLLCNEAYQTLFNASNRDELEGMPLLDMITTGQREEFKQLLRELGKDSQQTPSHQDYRFTLLRADNTAINALLKFEQASIDEEPCLQLTVYDLTEQEAIESRLKQLSTQDLVTGLLNRPYFLHQLADQLAAQPPEANLVVMRLDNYQDHKETIGLAGCDLLLRDVASILGDGLPAAAFAARYCDDAFSLWLPFALEDAMRIAESIRQRVETSLFDVENATLSTTCSIGLHQLTAEDQSAQSMLTKAESACAQAGSEGGNRIQRYLAGQTNTVSPASSQAESQISVNELRQALQKDDFRLAYQPIVSLHAEPGERYETLLRLHFKKQEIAPAEFLSVAEHHGLMADIDRWVIKRALSQLATKRHQGKNTHIFIKLSEASLLDPALLTLISTYLKAARLPGNCITFELAEELVLSHLKHATQLAAGLAELHCELAIEHVGKTGKPLTYLNHLEHKYLKISGELIHHVAGNKEMQDQVKRISALAQSSGKQTIAEFVHDANTLATLWQFGVNFVQGFYLQRPDPAMNYDFSPD